MSDLSIQSTAYLNYNPVLKSDLSKEISFHKWEAYKNITLIALACITFLAIATLGIWYAAFFAIEALPIIMALNAIGLHVTHRVFSQPRKLAMDHHFEAKAFEEKVAIKISNPSSLRFSENSEIGAQLVPRRIKERFTPLFARYTVLHEETDLRLREISRVFHEAPKFSPKGVPLNYQALKQNYRSPDLTDLQAAWYLDHLATYRANKVKIQDEYLERRVHEVFLAYNAQSPHRYGSFKHSGSCYTAGDLLTRRYLDDDSFFLFNPKTCVIGRKAFLDAHKEVARHILEERETRPTTHFTEREWATINEILERKGLTKRSRVSVDEELAPFIEKTVNKHYIELFSDHDAYSLRRTLSSFLFYNEYPKGLPTPKGVCFSKEELIEVRAIKEAIEGEERERALAFHLHPRIKEIIEAKIVAYRVS